MTRCLLRVVLLASSFGASVHLVGQPGSICGSVQNETGLPAARVHILAVSLGAHSGFPDVAVTDADGHYCVPRLGPGDYLMTADDTAQGYPNMASMLYSTQASAPRVTVYDRSSPAVMNWRIPYRACLLHVHLRDRATGQMIPDLTYRIAIRGAEAVRYARGSQGADTPLLLPPNEDVMLTLGAQGYKDWPADGTGERLMTLAPGSSKDLTVLLDAVAVTP